ncbi:MAG: UvrD-helicase domain-containing protein [Peptococcaceae bacterium]|nr:UvrD-helicase domain-containing protein [Peptococcaceae bacterium]
MYIADLHIHSHYSRATSRECVPEYLELWARRKGIGLLGTGDFTHPLWRRELKEKLQPAEEGLYRLKASCLSAEDFPLGPADDPENRPRFAVTGEISSIYKKNGKVRKVHNVIVLPSLEAADDLSRKLEAIGNIHSDGRPILGLDCRDLLEITLETCAQAIFIPAHIWTPHFSLFGAFSGFDTIEECFEDLTPHIHALETGLSSDPPMNWRLSALDRFHLVSTSDAHSPAKLGREATLIEGPLSYDGLSRAMELGKAGGLAGTIEFFPEEGKYHLDGHRGCRLCLLPAETKSYGGRCPVCGKKITIGVLHRVEQLADRPQGAKRAGVLPFESLAPLSEVIAASTGLPAGGVKVQRQYLELLRRLGPEFYILRQSSPEEIAAAAGLCVAEGIRRLRAGQVKRRPGYDGEYGEIGLLNQEEIDELKGQASLFGPETGAGKPSGVSSPAGAGALRQEVAKDMSCGNPPFAAAIPAGAAAGARAEAFSMAESSAAASGGLAELNPEQRQAVTAGDDVLAIIAGPGTGKTKTLVARIAYLVEERGVNPSEIFAVTFTNKAAAEMRRRLEARLAHQGDCRLLTIGTFHSLCLGILKQRKSGVTLISEEEAREAAAGIIGGLGLKLSPRSFLEEVSRLKNSPGSWSRALEEDGGTAGPTEPNGPTESVPSRLLPPQALRQYAAALGEQGCLDFDDLLLEVLALYENDCFSPNDPGPDFPYLLVDEFQDINALQHRLIRAWSRKAKSLFVIGDPDQSIYGFRGADAGCFDRLLAEKPEAKTIRLKENYRSTPEILACALPVIRKNPGGPRLLDTHLAAGSPVRLVEADSDLAEAIFVAKEINRLVGGVDMLDAQSLGPDQGRNKPRSFADIAVLFRTHRQAQLIEKCLRRESIPYVAAGREDFLAAPRVRGILGFFRNLLEPEDGLSLSVFLDTVLGCDAGECRRAASDQDQAPAVWLALAGKYRPRLSKDSPRLLLEELLKDLGCPDSEPLRRLINMSVFHSAMADFLENLLLGQEQDLLRASGKAYASGAVSLMTLHGSKGLEFPVVFLPGLKKGGLPLEVPGREGDLAEERRLFYVGMTRAREELILLTSSGEPSFFLSAIPKDQLKKTAAPKVPQAARQPSLF